jgi:hypothetical protein
MKLASPETPLPYPDQLIARVERDAEDALQDGRLPIDTIFPKVEALLNLGAYQNALGRVADRATMSTYRATIDFLLCELFPQYAEACQACYREDAPQARELLVIDDARRCEHAMICLLALAMAIREDLPSDAAARVSWSTIVAAALEIAAYAPPNAAVMQ